MGDAIGDAINTQMLAEGYIYDDDLGIPRELGDERYLVDPIDVLIQLLHHLGLVSEEQAEALSRAIPDATRTASQRLEAQKIIKRLKGLTDGVSLEPRDNRLRQFHRKDDPDAAAPAISVQGGRRKKRRKKTRKKRRKRRKKRTRHRR